VISASPSRRPLPALLAGLLTGLIGAGSLAPFVAPACAAGTVTPATGGGAISADTDASTNWTTLTGPSIAVSLQAGDTPDIPIGSIILTAPSGFAFNPSSTPTIGAGNSDLVGSCAAPMNATVTCTISAPTAAAKVGFTIDPVGAAGGAALSKQPIVAVQDTAGNTVTMNTGTVTLALSAGTGTAGAILTCTGGLSRAAAAGVATFAGCAIDKAGTGYKLTATVTGLTAATSAALAISQGPAKQLGFKTQPVGGTGGLDFPSRPVVAVQDAGGATVAAGTATVTLAITTGTGTAGAALSCTGGLVQTVVSGLATFSGCTIDRAGTGYTLRRPPAASPWASQIHSTSRLRWR